MRNPADQWKQPLAKGALRDVASIELAHQTHNLERQLPHISVTELIELPSVGQGQLEPRQRPLTADVAGHSPLDIGLSHGS